MKNYSSKQAKKGQVDFRTPQCIVWRPWHRAKRLERHDQKRSQGKRRGER